LVLGVGAGLVSGNEPVANHNHKKRKAIVGGKKKTHRKIKPMETTLVRGQQTKTEVSSGEKKV